ncbi:hypothetical protein [Pseudomonas sp. BIGb0164]|uniref:hypothetical protein n=1 Tax=Pseudomonas sp. BIGb0164 TaxID=2940605 RepID=UPI002169CC3B|nr:hypothetical protein [Pseudomonas sp. BIGb0164]MCS4251017.1 hypothetical protein [Pseudomonas sp. BIGb0164]
MRSNFHRFWQSTALPLPRRLSSFHDYMGHLKGILFSAEIADNHSNRLNSGSLRPLSISAAKILETFEPDIYHTTHGQTTDNSRTILPDKKITPALQNRGIQEEFITCAAKHGKAVISRNGNPHLHGFRRKTPQEQTNEEWEAEFSQPA